MLNEVSFVGCEASLSGGAVNYQCWNNTSLEINMCNFSHCIVRGTADEMHHGGAVNMGVYGELELLKIQFDFCMFDRNVVDGAMDHGSDLSIESSELEEFIDESLITWIRSNSSGVRVYCVDDEGWNGTIYFPDYFNLPINVGISHVNSSDWYMCGPSFCPCLSVSFAFNSQLNPAEEGYVNISDGSYVVEEGLTLPPGGYSRGLKGAGKAITLVITKYRTNVPFIRGERSSGDVWMSELTIIYTPLSTPDGQMTPPLIQYESSVGKIEIMNSIFKLDLGMADSIATIKTSSLIEMTVGSINITSSVFEGLIATEGSGSVLNANIKWGKSITIKSSNFTGCIACEEGAKGGVINVRLEKGGVFEILGTSEEMCIFNKCIAGVVTGAGTRVFILNKTGESEESTNKVDSFVSRGGAIYLLLAVGFEFHNTTDISSYFLFYGVGCLIFTENNAKEGRSICL
jgi:hypothetical protein